MKRKLLQFLPALAAGLLWGSLAPVAAAADGLQACTMEARACRNACTDMNHRTCMDQCWTGQRQCVGRFEAQNRAPAAAPILPRPQAGLDSTPPAGVPNRPGPQISPEARAAIDKMNAVVGEETPAGPYEGPIRFARVGSQKKATVELHLRPEMSQVRQATFGRSNEAGKVTERTTQRVRLNGVQMLYCQYEGPQHEGTMPNGRRVTMSSDDQRVLSFWLKTRPQLSDEALMAIRKESPFPYMIDAAVPACPADYFGALRSVFGDDWEARYNLDLARISKENQQAWASKKPSGKEETPEYARFRADPNNPLPALTTAEMRSELDPALVAKGEDAKIGPEMLAAVRRIEEGYDSMPFKRVEREIDTHIYPFINPLLTAARANFPGSPQAHLKLDFAEWEARFIRPLFASCSKLLAMEKVYADSGGALVGGQMGTALSKGEYPTPQQWASVPVNYGDACRGAMALSIRMLKTRLGTHPALDAKYMAKVYRAAKVTVAENARKPRPTELTQTVVTTKIFSGTPGEISRAMMLDSAGEAAKEWLQLREQREKNIQRQLKYHREFWTCYDARCDDGGSTFLHYMWLLDQYDRARFMHGLGAAKATMNLYMANLLSGRYTPTLNDAEYATNATCLYLSAAFGNIFDGAPGTGLTSAAQWEAGIQTTAYQNWAECRDQVEYLLRP